MSIKSIITSSLVLAGVLLASAPMAHAQVTDTTASSGDVEFKSTYGQCLSVLNDNAFVGATIRTYTCGKNNKSELFAVNKAKGHLHIYFTPKLCVANVGNSAVLEDCTKSFTDMTEKAVKKGVVAFQFSNKVLTAQKPTPSHKYPNGIFKTKGATITDAEKWSF